jgi:hypothetical protein
VPYNCASLPANKTLHNGSPAVLNNSDCFK